MAVADTVESLTAAIANVDAQLARPESVQFADRSERQRPANDLLRIKSDLQTRLAALTGRPRRFLGIATKGLGCS
jgi:hypothetical protein